MKQIKNKHTGEVILEVESLFEANLSSADLSDADLSGSNLRRIDLRRVDLYGVDLRDADLRDADLYGADLRDADLRGANLRRIDLRRVDLYGVDLRDANLKGADLKGALNYYTFIAYDTSKRLVHCVKHDTTWMVLAGCFWGTLQELEEKVLETHKSSVYLANIEILKTI